MSPKHSSEVFIGLASKGWVLEHFWKSHFWPIFDIFLKMSLKLTPLHLDFIFNFDNMILAIVNVKIPIIMPCYDFIVKFRNFDLAD